LYLEHIYTCTLFKVTFNFYMENVYKYL
jgi:hypothetical protein